MKINKLTVTEVYAQLWVAIVFRRGTCRSEKTMLITEIVSDRNLPELKVSNLF